MSTDRSGWIGTGSWMSNPSHFTSTWKAPPNKAYPQVTSQQMDVSPSLPSEAGEIAGDLSPTTHPLYHLITSQPK